MAAMMFEERTKALEKESTDEERRCKAYRARK
jgi:hypothetical protein